MDKVTIAELRNRTQTDKRRGKTARHHIGYVWHRNISVYITYVLVRWCPWCTANMVTVFLLAMTLGAAWLVSSEQTHYQLVGLLGYYLTFLLDKVDGEVARYHHQSTLRGAYLDEWYHVLAPTSLLVGLFAGLAYEHSFAMTLTLMLALVLTVVRRVERKWYLTVGSKSKRAIVTGLVQSQTPTGWLLRLGQSLPFTVASIVERFDLWLLLLFVVVGLEQFGIVDQSLLTVLLGYTVVSVVYALRFFVCNYFGRFDQITRAFVRDGF